VRRGGAQLQGYFQGVARARYVIRRVFRAVDECARARGLEPLSHQALIQIFGDPESRITVSGIAERLDVSTALASKLTKALVERGLAARRDDSDDLRVSWIHATTAGASLLRSIDADVHIRVEEFARSLTHTQRSAALAIFAFYVGIPEER